MITGGIRPDDGLTSGRIRLSHRAGLWLRVAPDEWRRPVHSRWTAGQHRTGVPGASGRSAHFTGIRRPTSEALQDIDPETTLG